MHVALNNLDGIVIRDKYHFNAGSRNGNVITSLNIIDENGT